MFIYSFIHLIQLDLFQLQLIFKFLETLLNPILSARWSGERNHHIEQKNKNGQECEDQEKHCQADNNEKLLDPVLAPEQLASILHEISSPVEFNLNRFRVVSKIDFQFINLLLEKASQNVVNF